MLPASLVAVIVYVPSKSLLRPDNMRINLSSLKTPVRLEKEVVRELDGMLTLVVCTLLKLQCILCAWTAGEASKMTKAKVTCISSKPTTLPRTGCTVGGTEGGGREKATA